MNIATKIEHFVYILRVIQEGFALAVKEKIIQFFIAIYTAFTFFNTLFLIGGEDVISLAGPLSIQLFYTIALTVLFYYRGIEQEKDREVISK